MVFSGVTQATFFAGVWVSAVCHKHQQFYFRGHYPCHTSAMVTRSYFNFFHTPRESPIQLDNIVSTTHCIIAPQGSGIKGKVNTSLIGIR